MTFDQGGFVERVRKWGPGVTLYSVDLSSATDRFPIRVLSDLLLGVFSENYVRAWEYVMVGEEFSSPVGRVSYRVGNPMGFLSSWASFALGHHFLVFICCQECGIPWATSKYVILGDDILIGDPVLGEAYRKRVLTLGVDISEAKSFTSPMVCEFAKRYLYLGQEVTPFPVSSVESTLGDVSLLVSSIASEGRKGLVPKSGVPGCVATLSGYLGHRKSFTRNREQRAFDSWWATSLLSGTLYPTDFVLKASGVRDQVGLDYLTSIAPKVLSDALRDTIRMSVNGGPGSIDEMILADVARSLVALRSAGLAGEAILDLPLFSVYRSLEKVTSESHDFGVTILEGLDPLEIDSLTEVLTNPLKDSSWGLDRRKRKCRAWSRLARACRSVAAEEIRLHGLSGPRPLIRPSLPMRFSLWSLYGYYYNFSGDRWIQVYLRYYSPPGWGVLRNWESWSVGLFHRFTPSFLN